MHYLIVVKSNCSIWGNSITTQFPRNFASLQINREFSHLFADLLWLFQWRSSRDLIMQHRNERPHGFTFDFLNQTAWVSHNRQVGFEGTFLHTIIKKLTIALRRIRRQKHFRWFFVIKAKKLCVIHFFDDFGSISRPTSHGIQKCCLPKKWLIDSIVVCRAAVIACRTIRMFDFWNVFNAELLYNIFVWELERFFL